MRPAGYLLKCVEAQPTWLKNKQVERIFSVCGCCSEDFADYIAHWKHNGHWLFNVPEDMNEIMETEGVSRSGLTLFYYEIHEAEFDEVECTWSTFEIESSFETNITEPAGKTLHGFDVVSYSSGTSPECSPLACNSLADTLSVNQNCLLETFAETKAALENGRFTRCEPGPYRIFAVYTLS